MAKLTDFQTPTGAKGNILSVSSWVSMILGTVMLFVTLGIGQNLARKVDGKGPIDSSVEYPFSTGAPVQQNGGLKKYTV